ncbi:hypothetical protein J2D73_10915 [Acetobacter sacchari]|uniref:Uncharacterized protein n=1 Tax=Acetobacter sacchari TaxID=2661687 RepID=A0ABS3LWK0_9PROT|nr:hypothetical protein [Acetobacter sacchari]MBO1360298.1 hypothetical protein [Acetobacter sacchari]
MTLPKNARNLLNRLARTLFRTLRKLHLESLKITLSVPAFFKIEITIAEDQDPKKQ